MSIKAIIFDWGRTLYASQEKSEYPDAKRILEECKKRNYVLAVASLVSPMAHATLEERKNQIETSRLRDFFELVRVTEEDKDAILEEIVNTLGFPRDEVVIVDDRTIRGIRYGNLHGHPTVWFQNGKFADELPDKGTGEPTFIIHSLSELPQVLAKMEKNEMS